MHDLLAQAGSSAPAALAAQQIAQKLLTAMQAEQRRADHEAEGVIAGRYRLLEKLGAGGMGTVYLAHDMQLGRSAAVKVLPPHLVDDSGAVARFRREALALARVAHPAIVQALDAGEDGGRHFLVMEFVEGTNLAQVVRLQGRIPPTLAADYVHQAAVGLHHAHGEGLVHRDLKPSNLLLTPGGEVKIVDLGLARFLQDQLGDAALTRDGVGLGTPDYMAPEQFRDARHADPRADVYALGCTLYHLLTGRVPFPGSSLTEKASAHEQQEPPLLAAHCPDAPAGLQFVVLRMMAKRPEDRFQTAGEAADALVPYLPVSSRSLPLLQAGAASQGGQLTLTAWDAAAGPADHPGAASSFRRAADPFESAGGGVARDISGHWSGTGQDIEVPGLVQYAIPAVSYHFEMTVRQAGLRFTATGSLTGQEQAPQPFAARGFLREDGNYVVLEWANADPQIRDYGIALLEYTADAKRLEGLFLGRERLHGSNLIFGALYVRRSPMPNQEGRSTDHCANSATTRSASQGDNG